MSYPYNIVTVITYVGVIAVSSNAASSDSILIIDLANQDASTNEMVVGSCDKSQNALDCLLWKIKIDPLDTNVGPDKAVCGFRSLPVRVRFEWADVGVWADHQGPFGPCEVTVSLILRQEAETLWTLREKIRLDRPDGADELPDCGGYKNVDKEYSWNGGRKILPCDEIQFGW